MIVKCAAKAEMMFAVTLYGGYNATEVSLLDRAINSVFTVGSWTPFKILLVIDIGSL